MQNKKSTVPEQVEEKKSLKVRVRKLEKIETTVFRSDPLAKFAEG